MLCDVILIRLEGSDSTQLQDALAAVQDSEFIDTCKVFSELLIVEGVRGLSATAFTGVIVE